MDNIKNRDKFTQFKFLFMRIAQFTVIFLAIDLFFGFIAEKIFFSQESGKYARITYSIEKSNSEILIMGSSHANRHYIPEIFEKNLGMTTYNSGVQGQQIIFITALQEMILERYKPKKIILNIDQDWMYESNEALERLADLHPYYWQHRTVLDSYLSLNNRFHTFKLLFKSYQFNSSIVHVIKYFFRPQEDFQGFRPLYGKMTTPRYLEQSLEESQIKVEETKKIDKNFVKVFKKFINNAKKSSVDLVFVISPHISNLSIEKGNESLKIMKEIADEENILVIDFSGDKNFNNEYCLFNDASHLNNEGAILFTNLLTNRINNTLEQYF